MEKIFIDPNDIGYMDKLRIARQSGLFKHAK